MRRLTTTLLCLALLLSLAAAVLAWDGDHDDDDQCIITKTCANPCQVCPDCVCGDCLCDPAQICKTPTPPLPPPVENDCDVLQRLCGKKGYHEHVTVDPAGVRWRKCHARRCKASVAAQ